MPPPKPPGAGFAAGNRAVFAMAFAIRAAVRGGAGGMALRPEQPDPPHHLAGGVGGSRTGRRRCPFGAFSPVSRPRAGHRGRGARDVVQTGRRCGLQRPRYGGGPRPVLRSAGRAGIGHPKPGNRGERRGGALQQAASSQPACGRGAAVHRDDRPARNPAGTGTVHRAAFGGGGPWHPGAGGAGDAVPQSPRLRAVDALPGLRPQDAVPQLHGLAGRASRQTGTAMSPLRAYRPHPGGVPDVQGAAQPDTRRPGGGAHHRGSHGAVPRCPHPGDGIRHHARPRCRRRGCSGYRGAGGRSDHRHPDRRQGLAFSAPDAGGGGGCGPRSGRRRFAGVGANGAAIAPGGGAGRTGRGAGAGAVADV